MLLVSAELSGGDSATCKSSCKTGRLTVHNLSTIECLQKSLSERCVCIATPFLLILLAFVCDAGPEKEKWVSVVTLIAAASSKAVTALVQELNNIEAKLVKLNRVLARPILEAIFTPMRAVLQLKGCDKPAGSLKSLKSIVQQAELEIKAGNKSLPDVVKEIKAWRQGVLTTWDGSGVLLTKPDLVMFCEEGVPVRIMVDDAFRADCLDSNDLVELFLCCEKDDAVLQPGATITMLRYLAMPLV